MTPRKLIAATLALTLFGTLALLPPFILLFRIDERVFGVPVQTVYVFALWIVLVIGAAWVGRALPREDAAGPRNRDAPQ